MPHAHPCAHRALLAIAAAKEMSHHPSQKRGDKKWQHFHGRLHFKDVELRIHCDLSTSKEMAKTYALPETTFCRGD
jgi:hypothetical protein